MNTTARLTVRADALRQMADRTEAAARDALHTWIVLGETGKYAAAMTEAAVLRRAAEIANISDRREYLRNNGISA